jgi:glycosyltransferase involved in cell wall biosynthesis
MTFMFWLAIICLFLTIAASLEIKWGTGQMTRIKNIPPIDQEHAPKVSVIIPACNEEATIEPALRSVLTLDYPDLEVIVVNDRSTDNTGAVLAKVQTEYPHLLVYDISKLPKGWLGKNHALHYGARRAHGEYLLFTDADIIFESSSLARAIRHMLENKLDHMCMLFQNIAPGGLLNILIIEALSGLMLLLKPWKVKDPKSKRYVGVGAFNLVKTSAYAAVDGHRSIAMHPIDDIMLGKTIKQGGFSQDGLIGESFLQTKWYPSVRDWVSGLMKNSFAFYGFSVVKVMLAVFFIALLGILPFWACLFTGGMTRSLFGAALVIRLLSFMTGFADIDRPRWHSLWSLVSPYIMIYVSIRGSITVLRNRGITWRGTYYPLDELRASMR